MSKNGTQAPVMQFDFSHLIKTETVIVLNPDDSTAFEVTVRMLTHGEKTDAQTSMMANTDIDIPMSKNKAHVRNVTKENMKKAFKSGAIGKSSLMEEVAAIQSWTLTEKDGTPVPVGVEAWQALPAFYAEQVVKVIERLNPDLDDDFQDGLDSDGG